MVKFIHTADWHLGMQAHFLPEEARARFAQDRFDAVRRIAEIAREEGCAFVLACGDTFESNHVEGHLVAKALDALAQFTVPVFLLAGNHDPLDSTSIYRSATWRRSGLDHITVIEDLAPISVPGLDGVEVIGSPWQTRHRLGDPLDACLEVPHADARSMRVVAGHGVVDELGPDSEDPSLISSAAIREALDHGRAAYVALGDRHSRTAISGTGGRAGYAGTPVATDYGQIEPNRVLIVTLTQSGCAVEARTVGDWHFERQDRELTGEQDVTALGRWLGTLPSKQTTVLKLALRGTLNLAASAALQELLERAAMLLASLNLSERHSDLIVEPDEADLAALEVSGYVREAVQELRRQASASGEQALVARDALNLLYRLAR